MLVIVLHWVMALVLMGMSLLLAWRKRAVGSTLCWALACVWPLLLAWRGSEFSTSYTMMYLLANLFLCTLSEVLERIGRFLNFQGQEVQDFDALHGLLFASGLVFALPAVYIYAQGDDLLGRCVRFALIAGTLAAGCLAFLEWKRRGLMPKGRIVRIWLTVCASCFTLACGLRSPMLLFYGAGLTLMTAARLMEERWVQTRATLYFLGLLCASFFPIMPML